MIGANLHRFYDGLYLFFDLETEGLNLGYSRPWQIAYGVANNHRIIDIKTKYIKWNDINVAKGAAIVTGFSKKEYFEKAEDPKLVFDEFDSYIQDNKYILVGHNILSYDFQIYQVWRRALGLKDNYSFINRFIDTNCLSKAYKKGLVPDTKNFFQWQLKLSNYIEKGLKTNLQAMGKEFQIDFDYKNLHRADNDIKLNHLVFKELLWKMDF